MRKFQSYLTEAAPNSETSALRSYVSKALKDQGIKEIGSSRGGYHIRFAIKGDGKSFSSFFSGLGISIKDYSGPIISDKYTTHTLKAIEDITTPGPRPKNIPKGTELYWVNSEISQTASGGQIFANKDLTPDSLSLAGQQLNTIDLITKTSSALKAKYPEGNTAEELIKLLDLANTTSDSISLSDIEFETKDLAKISSDFGEILSAIWAMKKLKFREVFYPSASNNKLIDFYGIRMGVNYPISVKSGSTGGKVTVMNIIKAIKSRAKTKDYKTNGEIAYQIFKIVEENTMKNQMIELHRWMNTKIWQKLAGKKMMNMDQSLITVEEIDKWTKEENRVKADVWIGNPKNRKEGENPTEKRRKGGNPVFFATNVK